LRRLWLFHFWSPVLTRTVAHVGMALANTPADACIHTNTY
jgi:hypothetical protein